MRSRLLLAGVLALAALALWRLWPSERRAIERQFDRLLEAMEKSGTEDQLTAFGRARRVSRLFSPGFLVVARPYEGAISDAQQLIGVVAHYRGSVERLEIVVQKSDLAIDSRRGTAEQRALLLTVSQGGGLGRQSFDFRFAWTKIDGDWLVHEAELLAVEGGSLLPF